MNGRLGFGVGTIGAFLPSLLLGVLATLLGIFASGASTAASATTITVNITAEVALVVDSDEILGGAINVGDTITGTYTYDSTTSDSNPGRHRCQVGAEASCTARRIVTREASGG